MFRDTRKVRDASLLIQQTESSNNQFAVQLEELEQLDVDVFIDYCLPGDQHAVPEGNRWHQTVLDLDSRCFEPSSLQQCRDISPGALCLRFLFLLECSKTLDR